MSIAVTINGSTYSIPQQGTNPPWGDDLTDLLNALVDVANNTTGTGDILTTSFTIANNQGSYPLSTGAANVTALAFDTSTVRSAIIRYSIYRSTNSSETSECGEIFISYKSTAGTWEFSRIGTGDASVTFSITNAGQIQYTSSNMSGSGYVGKMKFLAKAFLQS